MSNKFEGGVKDVEAKFFPGLFDVSHGETDTCLLYTSVYGSKKSNEVLIASESVLLRGSLILKRMLQQMACSEGQDTFRSVPRLSLIHICTEVL